MSAALSLDAWKSQADKVTYRNLCFINNQFVPASSGKTFDNISPIHGKVLTKVAAGDKDDIDRAVKAARHAFENGSWSRHRGERKKLLLRFADLIEKHNDELALLETLDMGKPIGDSSKIDVPLVAQCIRWYAEAIDKLYDEVAPTNPEAISLIRREPLGVIGAVVPWNSPCPLSGGKETF